MIIGISKADPYSPAITVVSVKSAVILGVVVGFVTAKVILDEDVIPTLLM